MMISPSGADESTLLRGLEFLDRLRAEGETEDEVIGKAADHAQRDHGMQVTPELAAKVQAAIRDR